MAIIFSFTKNKSPISHFEKQSFRWSDHNPLCYSYSKNRYDAFKINKIR